MTDSPPTTVQGRPRLGRRKAVIVKKPIGEPFEVEKGFRIVSMSVSRESVPWSTSWVDFAYVLLEEKFDD